MWRFLDLRIAPATTVQNLQLSIRRAAAIRAALAALDVPEDAFLVYARGEGAPVVATPDGVAERRNRRVEITVR